MISACDFSEESKYLLISIFSLLGTFKFKAMIYLTVLDFWLYTASLHQMRIDITEV